MPAITVRGLFAPTFLSAKAAVIAAGEKLTLSVPSTPLIVLFAFSATAVVPLYMRVMAPVLLTVSGAGVITRLAFVNVNT